jgi:hypothetical protein
MVEPSSKLPKYPEFWTIPLQRLEPEMAQLDMKDIRTIDPTTKYQEMLRAYTVRKGKEQAAAFDWNDVGLSPFLAQQSKGAQVANIACRSSEPCEWDQILPQCLTASHICSSWTTTQMESAWMGFLQCVAESRIFRSIGITIPMMVCRMRWPGMDMPLET